MRRVQFSNDNYYHIFNRGVEKRNVFKTNRNFERFLYLLYACNDIKPLLNSQFYYRGFASIVDGSDEREQLVDILCFCLMPNHYHLLLRQRQENGISRFMQKLGTGYTMYFNTKYARSGVLFQGVFKAKHINTEGYLSHLSRYIHLNPAELQYPRWKEGIGFDLDNAHQCIKNYPWSSYRDFLGENKFKRILNKEGVEKLYLPPKDYEIFVKEWTVENFNKIKEYIFD